MERRRYLGGGLAALSAALVTVALSWRPALAAESVLTPSPQTVQIGDTISLSFTDFQKCSDGENLTVRWDKKPLLLSDVAVGPASFTADAVVPSSPFGRNEVDAGCSTTDSYFLRQGGTCMSSR